MNELIKVDVVSIKKKYVEGGLDPILQNIERLVSELVPDLRTAKSRKEIASMAAKVSSSKVILDELGKTLTAEWKLKSKSVDIERKKARDFLDNLRDKTRKPLTDWENIEKERVEKFENIIGDINQFLLINNESASYTRQVIEDLNSMIIDDSWAEFQERAIMSKEKASIHLKTQLEKSIQYESEQAELEQLRKDKELRDKKDHEEKIAREAKEQAEKKAQEEARLQAEKVEKEKQEAFERERKAEQDKVDAEKRAIELEKKIIQDKKDAKAKEEKERNEARQNQELAVANAKKEEKERIESEYRSKKEAELERENNLNHIKSINNEIVEDLVRLLKIKESQAFLIVDVVKNKKIRNLFIRY